MADNVWEFLTNTGEDEKKSSIVQAQAFSLTKVLGLLAPVVATAGTWAASQIKEVKFTSGEVAAIIIAVLALWTITAAADVIARGLATSAEKTASGRLHMVTLREPLLGRLDTGAAGEGPLGDGGQQHGNGAHEDVRLLAVSDAQPPEFLVLHEDQRVTWESALKVRT